MGVFLQKDTFVREWRTDNDVKFKLNYNRKSFETEFGFTKGNGGKTYKFRLETYFNDVEGGFNTELDTQNDQARAVTTIRSKFPPKLSFLNEKLETRNQFEWYGERYSVGDIITCYAVNFFLRISIII